MSEEPVSAHAQELPNGPAAAAILAAGVGAFSLGVLSFIVDAAPTLKPRFALFAPAGPLSGVSTAAIALWAIAWIALSALWSRRNVNLSLVNGAAFLLLSLSFILTFPPLADLLMGR